MKYSVGDKVRIVSSKGREHWNDVGEMDKWLGKTVTISVVVVGGGYKMLEDSGEHEGHGWLWNDSMIAEKVEEMIEFSEKCLEEGVVVHCDTEEKAITFLAWATSKGKTWAGGDSYRGLARYSVRRSDTTYDLYSGMVCYREYYEALNCTILTYEEALLTDEPTLEAGRIVEYKSGDRYIYAGGSTSYRVGIEGCGRLNLITETTEIMAVYSGTNCSLYEYCPDTLGDLIWERTPEQTETQKKIVELEEKLAELKAIVE